MNHESHKKERYFSRSKINHMMKPNFVRLFPVWTQIITYLLLVAKEPQPSYGMSRVA
jgi:hypothetical protein